MGDDLLPDDAVDPTKADRFTVHVVVVFLGLVALASVAGGYWLAYAKVTIPDSLIALGASALGALGAVLARTSAQ